MHFKHIVIDTRTGETKVEPMKATNAADAQAEMQSAMDDCPLCQDDRALGELPKVVRTPFGMRWRPRWRELKRRVRRT